MNRMSLDQYLALNDEEKDTHLASRKLFGWQELDGRAAVLYDLQNMRVEDKGDLCLALRLDQDQQPKQVLIVCKAITKWILT